MYAVFVNYPYKIDTIFQALFGPYIDDVITAGVQYGMSVLFHNV